MSQYVGTAWSRQAGEPGRAYKAFQAYLALPGKRTVRDAYLSTPATGNGGRAGKTRTPRTWSEWSEDWHWAERADEYDRHASAERARGAAAAARQDGEQWAVRHARLRERAWAEGNRMMDQIATLLRFPVVRQTVTEGGKTVVYEPVGSRELSRLAMAYERACHMADHACSGAVAELRALAPPPGDRDEARLNAEQADRELEEWRQLRLAEISKSLNALPAPPTSPTGTGSSTPPTATGS